MIYLICYAVTGLACVLGTICGMGGGIIIKPVLDATGVMTVDTITFLSGCTVISMSCWSVGKAVYRREDVLDMKKTPILAFAAAAGGLIGKEVYSAVAGFFPDRNTAGGVQACLLFAATFVTLLYTVKKDRLTPRESDSQAAGFIIGLILGMLGAFLGIGGGPFNVAALTYFFSMPTKKATQNSLFVVLMSQLASTIKTVISGGIPDFDPVILLGMVLLGIFGSEIGRRVNKRIDNRQANLFLEGCMVLIMGINIYNIFKYLG